MKNNIVYTSIKAMVPVLRVFFFLQLPPCVYSIHVEDLLFANLCLFTLLIKRRTVCEI